MADRECDYAHRSDLPCDEGPVVFHVIEYISDAFVLWLCPAHLRKFLDDEQRAASRPK